MASLSELFATVAKASSEFSHGVAADTFVAAGASGDVAKDAVAPAASSDTEDSDQDLDAFGSPMKPWTQQLGRKTTGKWEECGPICRKTTRNSEEHGRSQPLEPSSSSSRPTTQPSVKSKVAIDTSTNSVGETPKTPRDNKRRPRGSAKRKAWADHCGTKSAAYRFQPGYGPYGKHNISDDPEI